MKAFYKEKSVRFLLLPIPLAAEAVSTFLPHVPCPFVKLISSQESSRLELETKASDCYPSVLVIYILLHIHIWMMANKRT